MKKVILYIIKICRKLFYNTPVHRSKIVNIIYEKLFHAAFSKEGVVQVPYEGCVFNVPARDITILPSLLNDCYEKEEIKILRQVLKPGMVFVDIGANIGLFSIIGAKAVGKKGIVYCFEPEPGNYSLLHENLALNRVTNAIPIQLAVGAKKATLKLHIQKNSIGTHSLLQKDAKSIECELNVQVIKLDDYFKLKTQKVDVLNIDVEGYEPFVLEGAKTVLRNIQYLLFEYSRADIEANYGINKMIKLLNSFPFIYGIDNRAGSLEPFTSSDFHKTKYINILATKSEIKL